MFICNEEILSFELFRIFIVSFSSLLSFTESCFFNDEESIIFTKNEFGYQPVETVNNVRYEKPLKIASNSPSQCLDY